MHTVVMYSAVFVSFTFAALTDAVSPHPVVVVLSFDGYRKDYFWRLSVPNIHLATGNAANPQFLKPAFPTKTHVNHFTLATGLNPEQHGVINDTVFDGQGEPVDFTSEKLYHHDPKVVPIWIENQNKGGGRHSGMLTWPGAEFGYQGKMATFNEDYSKHYPQKSIRPVTESIDRLQTIFEWIEHEETPANLVMAYFGELDTSHRLSGANTDATDHELREIDEIVKDFIDRMIDKKLQRKINLIIIGGHGRKNVKSNGIIRLHDYLDDGTIDYITMGANALVNPSTDDFQGVYDELKKHANQSKSFDVYEKDEIPDKWRLKKSTLLEGKIFLVAHDGYCFWNNLVFSKQKALGEKDFQIATDGYDNDDYYTRTIFIARGPRIKRITIDKPIEMIDVHPLLKNLLDLTEPASEVQPNTEMSDVVEQMLILDD